MTFFLRTWSGLEIPKATNSCKSVKVIDEEYSRLFYHLAHFSWKDTQLHPAIIKIGLNSFSMTILIFSSPDLRRSTRF